MAADPLKNPRRTLRRDAIARRDALTPEERAEASHAIRESVLNHIERIGGHFVHCYISFRSEVETRTLIEELLARGIRVVVPVVEGAPSKGARLIHAEIQGLHSLRTGAFGLDEPVPENLSELEGLDAVIVPLVAFDRSGMRLGYGKGFYDRFLSELPLAVERIGLGFAVQEVPRIPRLPHDEPMDRILTERESIQADPPRVLLAEEQRD